MAIGGFQQNAFQQDAFQIEASDSTYSFSNDPQFISKASARSTIAAALSVTFVGFVFVPPPPTLAAGYDSSDVVSRGAVINQYNAGVPQPPAAAAVVVSAQSSDIVVQRNVIYQAVASSPAQPAPVVVVTGVFSEPPVFIVSRKSKPLTDGFINTPITATWAFSQPELALPLKKPAAQADPFIVTTAAPTPSAFWFGAQVELRKASTRIEQPGFVFFPAAVATPSNFWFGESPILLAKKPVQDIASFTFQPFVATWSFGPSPERARTSQRPAGQDGFVLQPTGTATPTNFWFGAQVEQLKRPVRIEQLGFIFVPTAATTPSAFQFSAQIELLKKPTRVEQPGFVFSPPSIALPSSGDANIFVTQTVINQSVATVMRPPAQVVTPSSLAFSDTLYPQLGGKTYLVPDGQAYQEPPPPTWPFTPPPELRIKPTRFDPGNFLFTQTAAPAVTPSNFWFGAQPEQLKKPTRVEQPAWGWPFPAADVAVPNTVSALSSDITFRRTIVYQANAVAPIPQTGPPPTPTAFWFGESPAPQLGGKLIGMPDGQVYVQPTGATPTEFWYGAQVERLKKPTRVEQPAWGWTFPPAGPPPTPTNFWFGAQVEQLKKPTRVEQPGFGWPFPPAGPPPTPTFFPWSEPPAPQLGGKLIGMPDGQVYARPATATPTEFWYGAQVEVRKQPTRIEQPGFVFNPPVAATPSAFWFGAQVELLKKPTRIEQPGFVFNPPTAATPSNFWFGASPERIVKPKPLLTPSADIAFLQIAYTPTFFPWSPSPELIKKPTRVEQPGYFTPAPPPIWSFSQSPEQIIKPKPLQQWADISFLQIAYTPTFFPWSPSPERIIKPRPLLTPSADISFLQIAYTPSFWPWSPSPERIIKPRPFDQPGFVFVPPPPVPVPLGPVAVSHEPGVFRQVIVLYQFGAWAPTTPPAFFELPSPPGGGKKKYRRPHGAEKLILRPRRQVIYRSDDYGLRWPVSLFEALEREPLLETPEAGIEEAPRFEREVIEQGQPEPEQFQRAFGLPQPTVTPAPLPAAQAPPVLQGSFGSAPTLEALDDQDAIAALEALDQLDDPMFNLLIDHLINILKNG